ncbi:7470_t:CDS:2 [Dentiscutata erythropus]|uniref:7470_t:CDS:1 n=1 Tax=Dentiscutata erythropus TaxID=1348616 RepID=A0A9N9NWU7_9GLOM|nr:7470_t:CDS:2 [Dentiscutata erythropus]
MMNSFLINTTFLNTVSKLRKHFDNIQVSEIRITLEYYNKEGQNVDIFFGEDITTILIKKARLSLLLEDIRIKDISNRLLKEIVGDKWEDRVVYIRDKIQKSYLDQISLLEYYYFLDEYLEVRGEHLEERRWSRNSRCFIKEKFSEEAFKYVWKSAMRVYKLYKVRGVHNLLTVQHTTTNTLKKLLINDYSLLLLEEHKVYEEELSMFLGLFTPFAETQFCLISFTEAQI